MTSQKVVARSVGTSVLVERLFERLPVRRAEFQRSIKKHYVKLLKVMQSYALIAVGVKIVITNLNVEAGGASSKQTVLATQLGTASLLDTTSIVFGAAFAATLVPVAFTIDLDADTAKANMTARTPISGMVSSSGSVLTQEASLPGTVSQESTSSSTTSSSSLSTTSDEMPMDVAITPCTPGSRPTVTIRLNGIVSKAGVGTGRSDNERQFLFLNGRPVDNHKFNRTMNEVWRKYEMKQKPGFVLDLRVPPGLYDVNVTPDKREVMLAQEGLILDRLRAAVDEIYAPSRCTFQVFTPDKRAVVTSAVPSTAPGKGAKDASSSQLMSSAASTPALSASTTTINTPISRVSPAVSAANVIFSSSGGVTRTPNNLATGVSEGSAGVRSNDSSYANHNTNSKSMQSTSSSSSQFRAQSLSPSGGLSSSGDSMLCAFVGSSQKATEGNGPLSPMFAQSSSPSLTFYGVASREIESVSSSSQSRSSPTVTFFSPLTTSSSSSSSSSKKRLLNTPTSPLEVSTSNSGSEQNKKVHTSSAVLSDRYSSSISGGTYSETGIASAVEMMVEGDEEEEDPFERLIASSSSSSTASSQKTQAVIDLMGAEDSSGCGGVSKSVGGDENLTTAATALPSNCVGEMAFDMEAVRAMMRSNPAACRITSAKELRQARLSVYREKYASKQAAHSDAVPGSAETLNENSSSRTLSKNDFTRMRVVGQYSLGFIVAELDGDLFVMDQHACDEKYKFETLQQTTRIHQQPLLVPLRLQTSVAMESVIRENLEVFEVNGFRLRVDDDAPGQVESEEAFGDLLSGGAQTHSQTQSALSGGFISRDEGKQRKGRVQILSVPFSKSVQFGADDVNELASMIGDSNYNDDSTERRGRGGQSDNKNYLMLKNDRIESQRSSLHRSSASLADAEVSSSGETGAEREQRLQSLAARFRLPKLVSMFASRACRSAVMIGTALNGQEMRGIVDRMEGLAQPWNCPHGRPTMRHLVDLKQM
eukprot:gene24390-30734_t